MPSDILVDSKLPMIQWCTLATEKGCNSFLLPSTGEATPEMIQEMATKIIKRVGHLSYEERLRAVTIQPGEKVQRGSHQYL